MIDDFSELTFEQIKIGQNKEFQVKITESLVNDFAKLSGDYNPLHMDDEYSKSTKFHRRVVHGMLLASFLSRMVGMYLPGKNALYLSQSLEFHNPCFLNDEIIISSVVIDKSVSTKIIKIQSNIRNNDNHVLLSGVGKIILRDD
ncbi:MAG: enoyl-CoA hydratase [Dehalococcoidaceae bacterium]|nr:enoyl-CoA hydratase [Dehalococcoidaceae bacterium]|tara:strand:+ start:172 stop:603 length:432 start_codon:yes stop_codon:yes gene_type:complete